MELWFILYRGDSKTMDIALIRRLAELRRMSVPALQKTYREVFGEETRSSHKCGGCAAGG